MMTQTINPIGIQEQQTLLRTQVGGSGGRSISTTTFTSTGSDDNEARAAAVRMAQLITMRHRIDFLLNVTEQCNVTLPSIHEQRGNVSPIILGEAGGATWAI